MTAKMKLYIGTVVLGLVMVGGGLWFLLSPLIRDNPGNLAGSQWQAVSVNGSELVEGSYISLYFSNGDGLWGYSGCNWYDGSYSSTASEIRLLGLGATEVGCGVAGGLQQENTYYDTLISLGLMPLEPGGYYRIDDNHLKIYGGAKQLLLVFERIPEYPMDPADLAGTSWQLDKINGVTINESQSATLTFAGSGSESSGSRKGYDGIFDYSFLYEAYGDTIQVTSLSDGRVADIPQELRQDAGSYYSGMEAGNYRLTADSLEYLTVTGETFEFKPLR